MSRPVSGDSVHFSAKSDTWETPRDLFATLDREFRFDIDVCALPETAKCETFYSPQDDGLGKQWVGTCWCNPPYSDTGHWMAKAKASADAGATVVCLIPARTDTRYWHDYVMQAAEIRLLKGRLKFVGGESCAPFPSALVVFKPKHIGLPVIHGWDWKRGATA